MFLKILQLISELQLDTVKPPLSVAFPSALCATLSGHQVPTQYCLTWASTWLGTHIV